MLRIEVRIAGYGGQGVIKAGEILGIAVASYDSKFAAQTGRYGPEVRGGVCRSDIVISDHEIDYPMVEKPDILVVMSQSAFDIYGKDLRENGVLILDPDLVKSRQVSNNVKVYEVKAAKIAEDLGDKVVANMVMLGALVAITKIVSKEAVEKAVQVNVPKHMVKLNLEAFRIPLKPTA